jgi:hypothetical protein
MSITACKGHKHAAVVCSQLSIERTPAAGAIVMHTAKNGAALTAAAHACLAD